jgi:hypothetical protein
MIPRLARLVVISLVASAAVAGSAQAFAPRAGASSITLSQAANAPLLQVHDRGSRGHAVHKPAPVVVVRPNHHVRDGLCVTRQPVTGISCYRYLREQQFHHPHFAHDGGAHVHGPGCGHTPRWAHRHNQVVFLGWF